MPAFDEEFDDLDELGTRPVTHIVDGPAHLTPRVELLPAEGHTEGDIIVLVADADVCFAGDLCFFGVTPLAFQGDPAVWAEMLDAIADLAATIVPGHGPVGGEAEVRDLQAYLYACVNADGDVHAIPPGPWDTWLERERDAINVERAAMLARGDDGMPRRDAARRSGSRRPRLRLTRLHVRAEERDRAFPRGFGCSSWNTSGRWWFVNACSVPGYEKNS